MFIKNYFNKIADILESEFKNINGQGKNSSDKGELCERFIKALLKDLFSDQYKIFRGGQIINIDSKTLKAKQTDIILVAKNTVTFFGEKEIFPIECIHGIFSVTATLNNQKLFGGRGIIEEFKSVPKDNPQFGHLLEQLFEEEDYEEVISLWNVLFPYKCAFGFKGTISEKWAMELNDMVKNDCLLKNRLPDLIIVNKKGMIQKISDDAVDEYGANFLFTPLDNSNYGLPIAVIAHDLFDRSIWQWFLIPDYRDYFTKAYNNDTNSTTGEHLLF